VSAGRDPEPTHREPLTFYAEEARKGELAAWRVQQGAYESWLDHCHECGTCSTRTAMRGCKVGKALWAEYESASQ
jgi:hypothetical protein